MIDYNLIKRKKERYASIKLLLSQKVCKPKIADGVFFILFGKHKRSTSQGSNFFYNKMIESGR
jgi:hypothetical protein